MPLRARALEARIAALENRLAACRPVIHVVFLAPDETTEPPVRLLWQRQAAALVAYRPSDGAPTTDAIARALGNVTLGPYMLVPYGGDIACWEGEAAPQQAAVMRLAGSVA